MTSTHFKAVKQAQRNELNVKGGYFSALSKDYTFDRIDARI
jgi:hypothetical protein